MTQGGKAACKLEETTGERGRRDKQSDHRGERSHSEQGEGERW